MSTSYPKRLIEVDLPIREISAHARREKSVGPISTLHTWWARRPLAACRAALCASLWPDPADTQCPSSFRQVAAKELCCFAERVRTDRELGLLCKLHWQRWNGTDETRLRPDDPLSWFDLRHALLDFIADFASWAAARNETFNKVAVAITSAAHNCLAPNDSEAPIVLDPFAGGGSIPLEALRVGADVIASDLNPVAVVIQKALLEHGQHLANDLERFRQLSKQVEAIAIARLSDLYPRDRNAETPIAYFWARTIQCEGPACGICLPLYRSGVLAKRGRESVFFRYTVEGRASNASISFKICDGPIADARLGTIKSGNATCPACGYTTKNDSVHMQLAQRQGGAKDALLLGLAVTSAGQRGRRYVLPGRATEEGIARALERHAALAGKFDSGLSVIPNEPIALARPSPNARGLSAVGSLGFKTFGDFFSPRQIVMLAEFRTAIEQVLESSRLMGGERSRMAILFALALDRLAEHSTTLCRWNASGQKMQATFSRQAASIVWDFCEANPFGGSVGSWESMVECVAGAFDAVPKRSGSASVELSSATKLGIPDDAVNLLFTDPPYYDSVPYGDLSDFFYVWLRRSLAKYCPTLLATEVVNKSEEAIWNPSRLYLPTGKPKDKSFYELQMRHALKEARRVVRPDGIGVVVFAHTSTEGWEAILSGLVSAGWVVTASWPVDTEMGTRMNAIGTASLASSVHLVCRPRPGIDGLAGNDSVGSWSNVRSELPHRIHDWMPRMASEGVVGADAIFACLGPALEVFSRYSRVEKSSGEVVTLREYLEHVWAAVSREALLMIFEGADASGLEEDARLTAMWLWTLGAGANAGVGAAEMVGDTAEEDDEDVRKGKMAAGGFVMEFDAARKIAQGLGAHLEKLTDVVDVKGDKARLRSVEERIKWLFGKDGAAPADARRGKGKPAKKQLGLFAEVEEAEKSGGLQAGTIAKVGTTTLDRVHQAMILFGAGRSEALKRFVVQDGIGQDARFWTLADNLSKLYPASSDEKRWVDGVLARKKAFGFG